MKEGQTKKEILEGKIKKYIKKNKNIKKIVYFIMLLIQLKSLNVLLQSIRLILTVGSHERLLKSVDYIINKKKLRNIELNNILISVARVYNQESFIEKKTIYEKILDGLYIEEVPQLIVKGGNDKSISLQQLASFRTSLSMRSRKRQLNASLPEWILEDKKNGNLFIEELRVRKPWNSNESLSHTELPKKEGIAIKPSTGDSSNGVYLVHNKNSIQDVKNSTLLTEWDELLKNIKSLLENGEVKIDQWSYEEIIYEDVEKKKPGRDLKFYCFYGKVALVLEIVRFPEARYCMWTADGEKINTGVYSSLFDGDGVSEEQLELASKISSEIPAPFIRIDFIKSYDGLVFGEFTARPGTFDRLNNMADKWLGDYFLDAEERLLSDLLSGKRFEKFQSFCQKHL